MARNLLRAGYSLVVYTRTKEKAEDILVEGAVWKDAVKDVAKAADVVMTMVGEPHDVEHVYFGDDGILAHAKRGTYVIDFTTSKPSLAVRIHEAAKEKGYLPLMHLYRGEILARATARCRLWLAAIKRRFRHACRFFLI